MVHVVATDFNPLKMNENKTKKEFRRNETYKNKKSWQIPTIRFISSVFSQ